MSTELTDEQRDVLLEEYVDRAVSSLQQGWLEGEASARSAIPRSAKALNRPVGSEISVFDAAGYPDELSDNESEDHSVWQQIAYTTITIYATHQKPHSRRVYRRGAGTLAGVVRRTVERSGQELEAVLDRRLQIVTTATRMDTIAQNVAPIVQYAGRVGVLVDYARLAKDLRRLQTSEFRSQTKLSWGRDRHHAYPALVPSADEQPEDD